MSDYRDIRAALYENVANISGVPSDPSVEAANEFDGYAFDPSTIDTDFIRFEVIFLTTRPQDILAEGDQRVDGNLIMTVFTKFGEGTQGLETLAEACRTAFKPGTRLSKNSTSLLIEWCEISAAVLHDPPWLTVPVTAKWVCFTPND